MSFDHNFHSIVVTLGFSFTICLAKKSEHLILLEESFDAFREQLMMNLHQDIY